MIGDIIFLIVVIAIFVLVFWKLNLIKLTGYEASGDFKSGFSRIDFLLKDIEKSHTGLKKLKNINIPDNVKFTQIDTVFFHNTGVYVFECDTEFSQSKLEQYKFNAGVLSELLGIDVKSIITIAGYENEEVIKSEEQNITTVKPMEVREAFEKYIEKGTEIFDDVKVGELYRKLVKFDHRSYKKKDIRI